MKFAVTVDGQEHAVDVSGAKGRYRVTIGEHVWEVDARVMRDGLVSLLIGGVSYQADVTRDDAAQHVEIDGESYVVEVEEYQRHVIRTRGRAGGTAGGQILKSPMPGRITHVAVRAGDPVEAGDTLVVIEAMKMENELKAGRAGAVAEVRVEPGQAVNPGDVLIVITERR